MNLGELEQFSKYLEDQIKRLEQRIKFIEQLQGIRKK